MFCILCSSLNLCIFSVPNSPNFRDFVGETERSGSAQTSNHPESDSQRPKISNPASLQYLILVRKAHQISVFACTARLFIEQTSRPRPSPAIATDLIFFSAQFTHYLSSKGFFAKITVTDEPR